MTLSLKSVLTAMVIGSIVVGASTFATPQQATFMGRVVDTAGDPISAVTITLRNVDNGQVVQLQSDQNGKYFRRALAIGPYELTFEKESYVTVRDRRRLGTGRTTHDSVMAPAVVVRMDPGSSPEYAAAFEVFNAGELVRAIEILVPLVEAERDFAPGFLLLARSHFELGQWEDAIVGYRRVIELQPGMAIAHLDIGVAYMETGDLQSASGSFEKALVLQPEDASVHYNIGTIYIRADRVDEAIVYLTKATELDPEAALSHKALAFALVRRSDMEGAIRHLERYLEIAPNAPDAEEMATLLEQLRGS